MSDRDRDHYGNEAEPTTCAHEYNCYHPHCLCPRKDGDEQKGESDGE